MAKIGGEASAVPEYKISKNVLKHQQQESKKPPARRKGRAINRFVNKSIKPEELIKQATKMNPAVGTVLKALKGFIPGATFVSVASLLLEGDPTARGEEQLAQWKDAERAKDDKSSITESVAQFLFDNGGRWPDEGIGSFKEGYKGDREGILNLYQAMVQQAAHDQMAESDMKTQEKYQLYDPDERKSLEDKRATFLKNL